jgi:AhpD family alkylhydroperoxidase
MSAPEGASEPQRPRAPRPVYPVATPQLVARRRELAPGIHSAWDEFSASVFAAGALDAVTKQLIAVAAAHITQCPYCISGHTRGALRAGATEEQVMEAVWVATEMRAGGALAHSTIALSAMDGHTHTAGEAQE